MSLSSPFTSGIIITNSSSHILYINNTFTDITGYDVNVIGLRCIFLQGEYTNKKDLFKIRTSLEEKKSININIINYKKNGSIFLNNLNIVPIYNNNEINYIGFINEINISKLSQYMDKQLPIFPWLPTNHSLSRQNNKVKKLKLIKNRTDNEHEDEGCCDEDINKTSSNSTSKPSYSTSTLSYISETNLPTVSGNYRVRAYRDSHDSSEPIAIISGSVENLDNIICRVHDQCFTSEVLGSLKCDCKDQLDYAMDYIQTNSPGLIIYLPQEGRGMGLANKIKAYSVQEYGLDTVDSNHILGFSQDTRRYEAVAYILNELNIKSIQLLSNNPRKFDELTELGINITKRLPCIVDSHDLANKYLKTKQSRMQHLSN